jgi:hypothetical protein
LGKNWRRKEDWRRDEGKVVKVDRYLGILKFRLSETQWKQKETFTYRTGEIVAPAA